MTLKFRKRFGLRTMLGCVAVMAIGLMAIRPWILQYRNEARAISRLQQIGTVWTEPAVPDWLAERLGQHSPEQVVMVHLSSADGAIQDADMRLIGTLRGLDELQLGYTSVTDRQLAFLGDLRNLERMMLSGTAVSDARRLASEN